MLPLFTYHIFSKNFRPLYVDENGFVMEGNGQTLLTQDDKPAALKTSPDGWNDVLVKYKRDMTKWGLVRDFTVSLDFKLDGAKILRHLKYTYGIEAIGYLVISKLDTLTFPDIYKKFYVGEIDFSTFNKKRDGVTVNVIEGGLSKLLKAYENTKYEIALWIDNEKVPVTVGGLPFQNIVKGIFFESFYQNLFGDLNTNYVGLAITTTEGSSQGIFIQDVNPGDNTSYDEQWFLKNEDKNVIFNIKGSIDLLGVDATHENVHVYIDRVNNNLSIEHFDIYDAKPSGLVSVPFDFTATSVPGDRFYMITTVDTNTFYSIKSGAFEINYDVTFKDTVINGFRPSRLWALLVNRMTGGYYAGTSDFLKTLDDIVITSGTAIRSEIITKITTSITEFFKWASLMDKSGIGVGMGIVNNELRVERLDYFFRQDVTIELGEVIDFENVPATDIMFNTIKVGYQNQNHDSVNGKDDFAVTQTYTTPITRVVKELDLVSPYIASPYSIELLRLNLTGKDTTDNKGDNETFVINIETFKNADNTYHLNRPAYSNISGVNFPAGVFNTELSPKHLLLNCATVIHSVLYKLDAEEIKFASGEKNSELSTTLNGKTVSEKSGVPISSLPARLFLPEYATFKTQVPIDYLSIMQANTYNKVSFMHGGVKYYGWVIDGGIKPGDNEAQQWKLLLTAENDLTKLI